ncbi:hypothetical protein [Phytohabitans houttuyneae]|uniref:Chitin-binding type-3 domain-containing protein n=1 Tax=Phytohabitans houttuyneae TaxID=1076126 RepID=A0A6V8KAA4_9ACTN|nr:hypothetical protein [Phytohabitans houttuyneae]GFJ82153.1 hypothetical protein Phou_063330 [Phytohabitans houttuyneae]
MLFRRRQGRTGTRRRSRLTAWVLTASLAAGLAAVIAPSAAQAGAIVPCPSDIQYWHHYAYLGRLGHMYEGHRYRVVSATPRFLVSDGRAVTNGLPYPVAATVTANQTQTFQVTTTVGVAAQLTEQLTINVSTAITQIRSTMIGVSTSFEVPAYSTVYADYGVHGYDVSYYVEKWHRRNASTSCEEWGYYPSTVTAPTYIEGWQLRTG